MDFSYYFPWLDERQQQQLAMLEALYREWNAKINVVSRKDIDNLMERHVLHSLSIARFIRWADGSRILDVGTGGGFPGIPLAVAFPQCEFHLVDSIGKKILVATEVAKAIGLENVKLSHKNVKEERATYDFVVSRAVMRADMLWNYVRKNIGKAQRNAEENGLICLKGGELDEELATLKRPYRLIDLKNYFAEPFFETKKLLYIPA